MILVMKSDWGMDQFVQVFHCEYKLATVNSFKFSLAKLWTELLIHQSFPTKILSYMIKYLCKFVGKH